MNEVTPGMDAAPSVPGPLDLRAVPWMWGDGAVGLAPVGEELFFRGFLYNALRRRWPRAVALVVQAAVFGLLHTFGFTHAVFAGVLGLLLGLIYDWRRNLLTPVTVHALQNLAAVAA